MTTIHIALDLETWGKKPGCDLRSIGACVFDPVTGFTHDGSLGTIIPFYAATDNPIIQKGYTRVANRDPLNIIDVAPTYKYPLFPDPETVDWWNKQSADAQAAFADPMDLRDALEKFANWFYDLDESSADNPPVTRIWSHGAAFDPPILAAAYDACGLPVPWHYRAPRDTRTCFDMAGIDDHSAWLQQHPGPLGIWHHALDDAISEARAVCAAYARVADWRGGYDYAKDVAPDHER